MFSLFKSNPIQKLMKLHAEKLEEAMIAQRNGDIRAYSELTFEADKIDKQITELENQTKS